MSFGRKIAWYWMRLGYYHGNETEKAFKRKYSLSDRIRYYWTEPKIQHALNLLLTKLTSHPIPMALLRQYVPEIFTTLKDRVESVTAKQILVVKIKNVLDDYAQACDGE